MKNKALAVMVALLFAGNVFADGVEQAQKQQPAPAPAPAPAVQAQQKQQAPAPAPAPQREQNEQVQQQRAQKLSRVFSLLHAVNGACSKLSELADDRAGSDLVKAYAKIMASAHARSDAKLLLVAKKHNITISEIDPKTAEGQSLMDRVRAEENMLNSLKGDAFDKEYLTLVTGAQGRVIRFLTAKQELASTEGVKEFIGDMLTVVKNHRTTAENVAEKISEDSL